MIEGDVLEAIEEDARTRFENRLEEKERGPRALGWDTVESMRTRFRAATELYDFSGATVLDVGCGFGDFLGYLEEIGQTPREYVGVDISDDILSVAREQHPAGTYMRRNLMVDPFDSRTFDITVEFGVLNHELERVSNEAYARQFLRSAAEFSDAVLLNVLSRYREGDWEYEETVHYYSPEQLFGFAQEISHDVVVQHDFDPIPQKEFNMLVGL